MKQPNLIFSVLNMIGRNMDSVRFSYDYANEIPDQILRVQHLVNSILDLLESSTNLDEEYLRQRIYLLVDYLGLKERIDTRPHAEYDFLKRIIERDIVLETEGLSRFTGIIEMDLAYPDLSAIYKTGIDDIKLLDLVRRNLAILNFNLLSRYFHELDPEIHKKECKVSDLISSGLPANPIWDEDSW